MAVELYYFQPLGSNSGRMYLALLEKQVEFVEHELSGRRFEHLQPDYLRINPKGQVPTLVHDGVAITEGGPANEYIDEAFDGPPLRPADPRERWAMRHWCRIIDIDWGRALMMVQWNRVVPMFQGARTREEFEAIIESVPLPDRRRAWRRAFLGETPPEQMAESRRRLAVIVREFDAVLARQPWLAGRSFSLADIDLWCFASFIPDWMPEIASREQVPALHDWIARAGERPAVKAMVATRSTDRALRQENAAEASA